MFIPHWVFWIVYVIATFTVPFWVLSQTGKASQYDFVTPLLAGAAFFIFIAFGFGFWLAKLLF